MKVTHFVMDELINKVSGIANTLDNYLTKRIYNIELENRQTKEETSAQFLDS